MAKKDILDFVSEQTEAVEQANRRSCILQPGGLRDCVLTLPLADFLRQNFSPGGVDMIGQTEYLGILPGRTDIDTVRSLNLMDIKKLFAPASKFDLAEKDPLIYAFGQYDWIVTFLGKPGEDFEQNLIYTAHCSRAAEVATLALQPPKELPIHTAQFQIEQFIEEAMISQKPQMPDLAQKWLEPRLADKKRGAEIFAEANLDVLTGVIIIDPFADNSENSWFIDNYIAIAEALSDAGFEIAFLMAAAERGQLDRQVWEKILQIGALLEDIEIPDVLAILSCARGCIGNDSGAAHLGGAMGIKTAAVFGPTDPTKYKPLGTNVHIFHRTDDTFATHAHKDLQQKIIELYS